jgi:hypothetical protein
MEEEAAEILRGAFLPGRRLGELAEVREGVPVIEKGAGRGVPLEFKGIEEGLEEAVGGDWGRFSAGGGRTCGHWRRR